MNEEEEARKFKYNLSLGYPNKDLNLPAKLLAKCAQMHMADNRIDAADN